jgi:hypothetical protein
MNPGPEKLEKNILRLFNRACRPGRLDVAEHLLRALETLREEGCRERPQCNRDAVASAYLTVARLR